MLPSFNEQMRTQARATRGVQVNATDVVDERHKRAFAVEQRVATSVDFAGSACALPATATNDRKRRNKNAIRDCGPNKQRNGASLTATAATEAALDSFAQSRGKKKLQACRRFATKTHRRANAHDRAAYTYIYVGRRRSRVRFFLLAQTNVDTSSETSREKKIKSRHRSPAEMGGSRGEQEGDATVDAIQPSRTQRGDVHGTAHV